MKIWIDSSQPPIDGTWIWAHTIKEAKAAINFYEHQNSDDKIIISLDYTNVKILNWLDQRDIVDTGYNFHIHNKEEDIRAILQKNGWREIK